jgi:acyl carrier protein phosphodiesterase
VKVVERKIFLRNKPAILMQLCLIFIFNSVNYLAHAYLSFRHPEITTGNMISDFIKGKKQFDYPATIQKGIRLHRSIDHFTDTHPVTHELKSFFRPQYRLYSGAFADVVYDHFLANDKNEFASEKILQEFSLATYKALEMNFEKLPPAFQKMFPYMKEYDWLYNYRFKWGIEKSFNGLVRRATYLTESIIAFDIFNEHYSSMLCCYNEFFPSLKNFAAHQLAELLHS